MTRVVAMRKRKLLKDIARLPKKRYMNTVSEVVVVVVKNKGLLGATKPPNPSHLALKTVST